MQLYVGQQLLGHVPLKRNGTDGTRLYRGGQQVGPDTQTCESVVDKYVRCTVGCHKFPSEKKFKVLSCAMNRQGKRSKPLRKECNLLTRLSGRFFFFAHRFR